MLVARAGVVMTVRPPTWTPSSGVAQACVRHTGLRADGWPPEARYGLIPACSQLGGIQRARVKSDAPPDQCVGSAGAVVSTQEQRCAACGAYSCCRCCARCTVTVSQSSELLASFRRTGGWGLVFRLASRNHQSRTLPVAEAALTEALSPSRAANTRPARAV